MQWIVLGTKWMKIGTRNAPVETGKMIPDPSDDSLGWSRDMIPETVWKEVDWNKEMPYVIGIFDYDPSEQFADQMSMTRIFTFEDSDITSLIPVENQPYLKVKKVKLEYNPKYGDDRVCECGHPYYRHFDSYEDNYPCGCKYCECGEFKEMPENDRLAYGHYMALCKASGMTALSVKEWKELIDSIEI